jgi:hypothetical protein
MANVWLTQQEFRHLGRFRQKYPDVPISVSDHAIAVS